MLKHERLKELLHYDMETGAFIWRVSRGKAKAGSIAGSFDSKGYRQTQIDGKHYLAHRLAWFYVKGEWPKADLDHWNLNKADNRFSNLRAATHSQNHANISRPASNTSGHKGVVWHRQTGKWQAQIMRHTREEAAALYADAAEKYFGEFARTQ